MKLIKNINEWYKYVIKASYELELLISDEIDSFEPKEYPFLVEVGEDEKKNILKIYNVVYKSDFEEQS